MWLKVPNRYPLIDYELYRSHYCFKLIRPYKSINDMLEAENISFYMFNLSGPNLVAFTINLFYSNKLT